MFEYTTTRDERLVNGTYVTETYTVLELEESDFVAYESDDECTNWLYESMFCGDFKDVYVNGYATWGKLFVNLKRLNKNTWKDEDLEEFGGCWLWVAGVDHPEWGGVLDAEGYAWSKTSAIKALNEAIRKYQMLY